MPRYFPPISYEVTKLKQIFLWQYKLPKLLEIFENRYVTFNEYKEVISQLSENLHNTGYEGRRFFGYDIKEELDRERYCESMMIYDYLTFQFYCYGEHIFYVMPKLASSLMSVENVEIDMEEWVVPYPTCFIKFPDSMVSMEFKDGVIDVEGCYVEEIYDGKVKRDKRIGIRIALVDIKGELLLSNEYFFNDTDGGEVIDYRLMDRKRKCEFDKIEVLNSAYILIDGVFKYIQATLEANRNNETVEDDVDDIREEIGKDRGDGYSVRKKKNGFKGTDGVNVVVIAEKIKRKHPVFQRVERCLTVQHDVTAHWRYLRNDCFKKMKGQRVWVKSGKRGSSNPSRVATVYQVGRK